MVESTKQVSENYLRTEKGYADDWAAYIASCHMTAEEALDYIRTTNTQEDRAAHLVDMADLSARSTFVRNGNPWVHCYEEQQKLATMDSSDFLDKMEQLFNAGPGEVPVLGKYRVGESQRTVVSVGTRVMIREADGSDRPYLLLRLIPVEYLQNTWIFPTEFPLAEISMIVNLSINQNLRRAVDMAEHANHAKTRFLSTMSHDIRNPLTALLGYLDLAKNGQYRSEEELQSFLDAAYGKAEQLKTLTDELFRYSLLFGCKELPMQMESYDARLLLEQLLGESRVQLQQQGFTVQLLLPQQEVQIEADVMYLKRVLDNLFDNIRKYADPAKPVAIAALIEDGALHICLSNSVNPASGRIESNKIGLRTCAKIMAQMAGGFKRYTENGKFTAEGILPIQAETMPSE